MRCLSSKWVSLLLKISFPPYCFPPPTNFIVQHSSFLNCRWYQPVCLSVSWFVPENMWRLWRVIGKERVRRHTEHSSSVQTSWATGASGDALANVHLSGGEEDHWWRFSSNYIACAHRRINNLSSKKQRRIKTSLLPSLSDPSIGFPNLWIHKANPLLSFECIL